MNAQTKATLIGILAPVCWGMSVGLVKMIGEHLGLTLGPAILVFCAAIFVSFVFGLPRLSDYSLKYIILGIGSASLCELSFFTSVTLSQTPQQTLEVGMINYLWPCLTILAAIVLNNEKCRWYVVIGFALALFGIGTVLSGRMGIDFASIANNVVVNPASYILAFVGACAWAVYSALTRKWANGKNPVVLVFLLNFLIFASMYACGIGSDAALTLEGVAWAVGTASVMGLAYGVWTHGVMHGSITILSVASYFTPVLSCLFSCWILGAVLDDTFWYGVAFVVAGSMVCWLATLKKQK